MQAVRFCSVLPGFLALVGLPRLLFAQPVGSEFQVNTYTTFSQSTRTRGGHLVASDANGNFIVVWPGAGQGDPDGGIFGQRYDSAGDPLGTEFRVNSSTPLSEPYASVAAGANGDFVVVWSRLGAYETPHIFGQRFDSAGNALGSEFQVSQSIGFEPPSVAAAANGAFVVVWATYYGFQNSRDVMGRRYDSAGQPLGPQFRVNSYTTDRQYYPSVASDASGNFVVVWRSQNQNGSGREIFGQRYDSGGVPQGGEFRVNSYTTGDQWAHSVASDPSGNFVAVWAGAGLGYVSGVFGQRYDSAGNAVGGQFRVNSFTQGGHQSPSVALDASGNFVVAWSRGFGGPSYNVRGQRFDSAGVARGGEFQINSHTPYNQYFPSVWSNGANQFVVVWGSVFQDGSYLGVFGQRYDFSGQSPTVHSGDLDGRGKNVGASWRAQVKTLVHDDVHSPVAGALVIVDVSGSSPRSCTTTASGSCEVSVVVSDSVPSLTFTVTNLSKAGYSYDAAANHDPDGDSNGTVIVVRQP